MQQINLDGITREEIATILRAKPDTRTITFAGAERHIFVGGLTYDIANAAGVELGSVLETLSARDAPTEVTNTEALRKLDSFYDALAWFLYVAMWPFEETAIEKPALIKLHLKALADDELLRLMSQLQNKEIQALTEGKPGTAEPSTGPGSASPASASGSTATDSSPLTS